MRVDDAWRAVLELAASQYGSFNRRQAADRNVTSRRLRRAELCGELRRPLPDVFVLTAAPVTWHQQLKVQTLLGQAVASHRAAAHLHGLDGFGSSALEVCIPRDDERLERKVRTHSWRRTEPEDLVEIDGIPCTSVARTLVQLGSVVARWRVEKALDSALRSGVSAVWIEDTLERLWRPGKTGAGTLRRIIDDPRRLGALPDSWFERLLQQALDAPGLPPAELQYEVRTGSSVRRLDLAYPEVKLGVEAHSRRFHFGPARTESDNLRDLELAAVGWEVIYVTWSMAHEPAALVRQLTAIYQSRLGLVERDGRFWS